MGFRCDLGRDGTGIVSNKRETYNNDMSSGLKANKALQPESTMYLFQTLSAVILMNSNFLKIKLRRK